MQKNVLRRGREEIEFCNNYQSCAELSAYLNPWTLLSPTIACYGCGQDRQLSPASSVLSVHFWYTEL